MKRLILLFVLLAFANTSKAQLTSFSIQGIDCNNSSGYVALNATSLLTQWQYKTPSGTWVSIPDPTYSFITFSALNDTLFSTECGEFSVSVWYNGGASQDFDTFSIACPLVSTVIEHPIPCFGDSLGVLEISALGGTPFDPNSSISNSGVLDGDEYYNYTWYSADDSLGTNPISLSDTTSTLDSIPAGWYKTVVRDAIGCKNILDYYYYDNPLQLSINSLQVTDNACVGGSSGLLSFAINGGVKIDSNSYYSYYLVLANDTVATSTVNGNSSNYLNSIAVVDMQSSAYDTIMFTGLASGTYSFIVADSNNCIAQDTFAIVDPTPYSVYTSSIAPLICSSDSANFIIDSVTGGIGATNFYYLGYGNDTIYAPEGTYLVRVQDTINACSDTFSVVFDAQYDVLLAASIQHIDCYGDSTGSVMLDSIYGGVAPYTQLWSSISPQGLSAGVHSVLITDSLGCTLGQSFTLTQGNQLLANAVLYPPSCNGELDGSIAIDVLGGSGYLNYWWVPVPGQTIFGSLDSITGLIAGTYYLYVEDSLSCSDTLIFNLTEPDVLGMSLSNYQNPLLCNGSTTLIDVIGVGGTAPYTVLWNDGDTSFQRNISAGVYFCVLTDANGCVTSDSVTITEPIAFSNMTTIIEPTCSSAGSASVSPSGGTPPYQYLWSTGDTTSSIDSLLGTAYQVIVADFCGATDTTIFTLTPFQFETDWYYSDTSHQAGVSIVSSSTGGPFSYEWSDVLGNIVGTDSVIYNLCEGTYYVSTTDNISGCVIEDTINATYYLPNGIVDITTTTVLPDNDLWGAAPYSYFWVNGAVTAHANICSGSHWVEVTDTYGCMVRADFDIDPLLVSLDPGSLILECEIENLDVEIEATASGGTAPYTYQWSNGSTESTLNLALNPGKYTVTVMDNNACTVDTSFSIAAITSDCVPNVFTPNGDNINDTWNLENTFLYADSEVKIHGRYGKVVFSSVGYEKPWDGNNESGNPVVDGPYFYIIDIGPGFEALKGTVTIIR